MKTHIQFPIDVATATAMVDIITKPSVNPIRLPAPREIFADARDKNDYVSWEDVAPDEDSAMDGILRGLELGPYSRDNSHSGNDETGESNDRT